MIKEFKFLGIIKEPRISVDSVKLKDKFNRNKDMLFMWSEFPYDGDDSRLLEFNGNILEFYNLLKCGTLMRTIPIIYEIFKKESGYFDRSMVYSNRSRFPEFIRRKAKLKIIYIL